jgi:hypothetical protein
MNGEHRGDEPRLERRLKDESVDLSILNVNFVKARC